MVHGRAHDRELTYVKHDTAHVLIKPQDTYASQSFKLVIISCFVDPINDPNQNLRQPI